MASVIALRYPAKCHKCGAALMPGSLALWMGGGRVMGQTCHSGTLRCTTKVRLQAMCTVRGRTVQDLSDTFHVSEDIMKYALLYLASTGSLTEKEGYYHAVR